MANIHKLPTGRLTVAQTLAVAARDSSDYAAVIVLAEDSEGTVMHLSDMSAEQALWMAEQLKLRALGLA